MSIKTNFDEHVSTWMQIKPLRESCARLLHVTGPPITFITRMILSDVAAGYALPGKRKINLGLDVFSRCDLFLACFVLKAEFTEQPRGEENGEDNQIRV